MIHAPVTLRRLTLAPDARGAGWRVTRETGPDPAQALVGRTPQEAGRLAPLVFNLCGAAHGHAAAAALGLPAQSDAAAMARESVRDHALAILHAWPAALGASPDRETLRLLARPDGDRAFATALVGDGSDLSGFSLAGLEAWLHAAPTGTARLLARIRHEVDPAQGRAGLPELTEQDVADALAGLTSPLAGEGAARRAVGEGVGTARQGAAGAARLCHPSPLPSPTRGEGIERSGTGRPAASVLHETQLRETSALGRVGRTPLLAALLAAEGPSLFVRLIARLVDCLAALRPAGAGLPALPPALASGLGLAPAARGLLGHGARVEGGRVAAYRILSPSAWNLAPGGLLDRAFAALAPGPDARRLAPLLISALNPCVPVSLAFAEDFAHA